MGFQFKNDIPIYIQIVEQVKRDIILKKYNPNEKIPSVREFSIEFEVNPNTVVKALTELEQQGLIYTKRTNGKFVTGDIDIINKSTKESVNKTIEEFFNSMAQLGYDRESVIKMINGEK